MRASSILFTALVAGSTVAVPSAIFKGHLHRRDHAILLRRTQESDVAAAEVAAANAAASEANIAVANESDAAGDQQVYDYAVEDAHDDDEEDDNGEDSEYNSTEFADGGIVGAPEVNNIYIDYVQSAQSLSVGVSISSATAASSTFIQIRQTSTSQVTSSVVESSPPVPTSYASSSSNVPETISYSPFNNDHTCKSADAVYADLAKIASVGIKAIRVYGIDCDSTKIVQPACVKLGLKIDQGFWIGPKGADAIDTDVKALISWVKNSHNNDWSIFTTFTVGNEAISGGFTDGPTLLAKIKSVKSTLRAAGWTGTVTTAETPQAYINYPALCQDPNALDYVGVNEHPYFDPSSTAGEAGKVLLAQSQRVQQMCNNREVRITETGYPSAGSTNGKQVPTLENQALAIASIIKETKGKAVMFTMYDDMWKDPGSRNVEQHFGIFHLFQSL